MISKEKKMQKIKAEVCKLTQSPLYMYRIENNFVPVIGEGSLDAQIVFVGEAPGKNEALTGRPFCGASGKMLDQLLKYVELDRKNIYITNIVKDRPQDNRDPSKEEIELYVPFLMRQLQIIQPKIIAMLGRFSMEFLMKEFGLSEQVDAISKLHGKKFIVQTQWGKTTLISLYHPAVAIYNRSKLNELEKDFEQLKTNNY